MDRGHTVGITSQMELGVDGASCSSEADITEVQFVAGNYLRALTVTDKIGL